MVRARACQWRPVRPYPAGSSRSRCGSVDVLMPDLHGHRFRSRPPPPQRMCRSHRTSPASACRRRQRSRVPRSVDRLVQPLFNEAPEPSTASSFPTGQGTVGVRPQGGRPSRRRLVSRRRRSGVLHDDAGVLLAHLDHAQIGEDPEAIVHVAPCTRSATASGSMPPSMAAFTNAGRPAALRSVRRAQAVLDSGYWARLGDRYGPLRAQTRHTDTGLVGGHRVVPALGDADHSCSPCRASGPAGGLPSMPC